MKTTFRSVLLSLGILCSAASLVCAAPVLDVKITSSSGKVVYRGKTDSAGMFTTKSLAPGSYVVQFNSSTAIHGGPLALVVHAGDQESAANSVPASKFSKGGVAMKVPVSSATVLTGQVAPAGSKMAQAATTSSKSTSSTTTNSGKKSKLKTKVVDGKTFVWIGGDDAMGSSFGGHWVPEDSAEGKRAEANAR